MNSNTDSYSLTSESRRWWWPSATAGGVGVAAIAAILVLPTTGHATPVDDTRQAPSPVSATVFDVRSEGAARPCFMIHPRWNTALDGPQPTCGRTFTDRPEPATNVVRSTHRVLRLTLDYAP